MAIKSQIYPYLGRSLGGGGSLEKTATKIGGRTRKSLWVKSVYSGQAKTLRDRAGMFIFRMLC